MNTRPKETAKWFVLGLLCHLALLLALFFGMRSVPEAWRGRALDESIRLVMDTCPEAEFKAYRRTIGQIMGAIYLDVMRSIHRRFPDLEPEELKK